MLIYFSVCGSTIRQFRFFVVPVIWLHELDHCYWPTGMKNVRTAIVKEMSVKDNFIKYKCHIFSKDGK
jgi:hypothetical protein